VDRLNTRVDTQKNKFDESSIAKLLFWVNFPLSVLAAILIVIGVFWVPIIIYQKSLNWGMLPTGVLLLSGFAAEVVYHYQCKSVKYAQNGWLWLYSIGVNILFISFYIFRYFNGEPSLGIFVIIYPVMFFSLSCIALYKIKSAQSIGLRQ
jgi:hypothetical protein